MSTEEKNMLEKTSAEKMGMDEASFRKMQEAMRRKQAEEEAKKITLKKILNVFYLGFFLFLVCMISAMIMGYADRATFAPREKAKKEKLAGALKDILPSFDNDVISTKKMVSLPDEKSPAVIYTAKKNGKTVAYAVECSTEKAYGGKMVSLISFSPDQKIYSFVISEHSETPGLGAEVAERKEKKTFGNLFAKKEKKAFPENLPPGAVLDQFRNRSAKFAPWRLRSQGGDIDGRSGATITSAAVTLLASQSALALKEMLKKESVK